MKDMSDLHAMHLQIAGRASEDADYIDNIEIEIQEARQNVTRAGSELKQASKAAAQRRKTTLIASGVGSLLGAITVVAIALKLTPGR